MGYIAETPEEKKTDSDYSSQNFYSEFLQVLQNYVTNPSEENYKILETKMEELLNDPTVNPFIKQIINSLNETLKKSHNYIKDRKDKVVENEKELKNYQLTPEQKAKYENQLNQAKDAYAKAKEKVQAELNRLKSFLLPEKKGN